MENKRLLIAIVLCCLIFLGWQVLSVQMGWIKLEKPKSVATLNATQGIENSLSPEQSTAFLEQPIPTELNDTSSSKKIVVETPLYRATFSSQGGILESFELKKYLKNIQNPNELFNLVPPDAKKLSPLALIINGTPSWKGENWRVSSQELTLSKEEEGNITFTGKVSGMTVTRRLTFKGDSYIINEQASTESSTPKTVSMAFTFGATSLAIESSPTILQRIYHLFFGGKATAQESQYNRTRLAWLSKDSMSEGHSQSDVEELKKDISWMGVMNNYFLGAISIAGGDSLAKGKIGTGTFESLVGKSNLQVDKGQVAQVSCDYFLGPKEAKVLATAPNSIDKALNYGFFSIISKPLVHLLEFFYAYVGNYGVAIILMTLLIKIIFWPLSQKSYKSMNQLRKLQPLMQRIREKHADDKETMNKEMINFYRTHKVNPAGGCLPIIVQIPVFFGLYNALLNAIELRHAPFISHIPITGQPWLIDLAAADPYCITPLTMGATMFLQQKMTPTPGDPTQAKVMMFMPVIFTVLFLGFPAGLVLYWLTNNTISIAQQWWQMRSSDK